MAACRIDALRPMWSNDAVNAQGRILAIDYGMKNIGLACSDELRFTVQPLESLQNLGKKDFLKKIRATVQTLEICELVIGIPINMDGSKGASVDRIDGIVRSLKGALRIPISGTDERLSTVEALEIWRGMTPKQQKRYRTVDSLAAALILERFLRER